MYPYPGKLSQIILNIFALCFLSHHSDHWVLSVSLLTTICCMLRLEQWNKLTWQMVLQGNVFPIYWMCSKCFRKIIGTIITNFHQNITENKWYVKWLPALCPFCFFSYDRSSSAQGPDMSVWLFMPNQIGSLWNLRLELCGFLTGYLCK